MLASRATVLAALGPTGDVCTCGAPRHLILAAVETPDGHPEGVRTVVRCTRFHWED